MPNNTVYKPKINLFNLQNLPAYSFNISSSSMLAMKLNGARKPGRNGWCKRDVNRNLSSLAFARSGGQICKQYESKAFFKHC